MRPTAVLNTIPNGVQAAARARRESAGERMKSFPKDTVPAECEEDAKGRVGSVAEDDGGEGGTGHDRRG